MSKQTEWCPQHGYPEPCAKCNGMAPEEWERFLRAYPERVRHRRIDKSLHGVYNIDTGKIMRRITCWVRGHAYFGSFTFRDGTEKMGQLLDDYSCLRCGKHVSVYKQVRDNEKTC